MTAANLRALRTSPDRNLVVRKFRDGRGAVLVTPRALVFVEVIDDKMTENAASWLYDLDRALAKRPTATVVVRTEDEVRLLVESLARRPGS